MVLVTVATANELFHYQLLSAIRGPIAVVRVPVSCSSFHWPQLHYIYLMYLLQLHADPLKPKGYIKNKCVIIFDYVLLPWGCRMVLV